MNRIFIYVVDRDFGFAPNPFHGFCTLATCKPKIRKGARIGDWVFGVGGDRLKAAGHCVFAMKVTEKVTFNQYWADPRFNRKKPIRNGSLKSLVGDNIYHWETQRSAWMQIDSHHSMEDGTPNILNLTRDTSSDCVLVSECFFYFGKNAQNISAVLESMKYKNGRAHRVFSDLEGAALLDWVSNNWSKQQNQILGDPFDFQDGYKRYSLNTNKVN